MQSNVTIVPDELGNVIRVSKNNSDYGHVRITQESVSYTPNGWVKKSSRSTLIHGTVEDLTEIGIAEEKTLPGKIVIKESTDAFNSSDPDRDLKVAGDTGVICCAHGEPIYRKAFYTLNDNDQDEFLAHTNGDAIKEAQAAASSNDALKNAGQAQQAISTEDLAEIQNNIEAEKAKDVKGSKTKAKAKAEVAEEVVEEADELIEEEKEETFDL